MPDREFTYKVNVDTASARAAAAQVQTILGQSIGAGSRTQGGTGGGAQGQAAQAADLAKRQKAIEAYQRKRIALETKVANHAIHEARRAADQEIAQANRVANQEIAQAQRVAAADKKTRQQSARMTGGGMAGPGVTMAGVIGGVAAVGAAAYAVNRGVSAAISAGTTGAEIDRITRSFDQLAAAAGLSSNVLKTELSTAVQGTVTQYDLLSRANLLLASAQEGGLDINEKEIAQLAKLARLKSTQLTMEGKPLSTEEAFSRLIRGTVKRETELLDELGLSTKQLADQLGVPLSAVNKDVQSLLDSILLVAEKDLATFGEPIADSMTLIEQASVRAEEKVMLMQRALSELAVAGVSFKSAIAGGVVDFGLNLIGQTGLLPGTVMPDMIEMQIQRLQDRIKGQQSGNVKPAFNREDFMASAVSGGEASLFNTPPQDTESLQENLAVANRLSRAYEDIAQAQADGVVDTDAATRAINELSAAFLQGPLSDEQLSRLQQWVGFLYSASVAASMIAVPDLTPKPPRSLAETLEKQGPQLGLHQLNEAMNLVDQSANLGADGAETLRTQMNELAKSIFAAGEVTAETLGQIDRLTGRAINMFNAATGSGMGWAMIKPLDEDKTRQESWDDLFSSLLSWGEQDHKANEQAAAAAQRASEQAAKEAQRAWEAAAKEAERAWKSAFSNVPGIPGLSGESPLTQTQLDQAAEGVPQNFADNFVRRMKDELRNKPEDSVDWPEIERGFIEKLVTTSTGIDPSIIAGLKPETLAGMAGEEISSGRVFATMFGQENIDKLVNFDAIGAELSKQAMGKQGSDFMSEQLKMRFGEDMDFDGIGNAFADGFTNLFAQGEGGIDVAGPMVANINGQFAATKIISTIRGLGTDVAAHIFDGFSGSVAEQAWAQAIASSIKQDIIDELISVFNGGNP